MRMAKVHCFKQKFKNKKNIVQDCQGMPDYPPPGSSFIFELNRKGKEYYVRAIYNGVTYTICGGEKYCKYEEFEKMMRRRVFLPKGIFHECLNQRRSMLIIDENKKVIRKNNWINGSLLILFFLQLLAIIITCSCWRRKRARKFLSEQLEFDAA